MRTGYVIGVCDTKAEDHLFAKRAIQAARPAGLGAALEGAERGAAITAVAEARRPWLGAREDVGAALGGRRWACRS